jgi:hypothetical protein
MKTLLPIAFIFVCATVQAQEAFKPATPHTEHEWLKQLAGEWTTSAEAMIEPGKPPFKCEGTESSRILGGLWYIGESNSKPMGTPVTGIITIGYDPDKKKFVGSWVDTMQHRMWTYEGTLKKDTLTLEADGPHPTDPSKTTKYRDVIELKGKDQKQMRSSMQMDGKWVQFMTMDFQRK